MSFSPAKSPNMCINPFDNLKLNITISESKNIEINPFDNVEEDFDQNNSDEVCGCCGDDCDVVCARCEACYNCHLQLTQICSNCGDDAYYVDNIVHWCCACAIIYETEYINLLNVETYLNI